MTAIDELFVLMVSFIVEVCNCRINEVSIQERSFDINGSDKDIVTCSIMIDNLCSSIESNSLIVPIVIPEN